MSGRPKRRARRTGRRYMALKERTCITLEGGIIGRVVGIVGTRKVWVVQLRAKAIIWQLSN